MAPRPLPQSWSSPSPLQWHRAMAPTNGTTSTPPKLVVTLPPNHSTLQWHPAMAPWCHVHPKVGRHPLAHYNGTLQWHPAMAPRPLPQSWSSPSPTIAHYNGTLRWHPAMAPWCHVQSPKVVRRPHPLLEVRTPIAIAIWGIINRWEAQKVHKSLINPLFIFKLVAYKKPSSYCWWFRNPAITSLGW